MAGNSRLSNRRSPAPLSRRSALRMGAAGAGIAGMAAIGCGGGNKGTSGAPQPASSGAAAPSSIPAAAATAGNFKTGGTIQLQFDGQIALDPYTSNSYRTQILSSYSYSRLLRYITGPDPSTFQAHKVVGDLVDSYEITSDGLQYTLKLRKNAMINPPVSRALTSADVLASYTRLTTDPKSTNAGVFKPFVDSLTAPDDQTLVFKLKMPYAPFLNTLATPLYFWVMPKEVVDGKIDPSKQPTGTGPWRFVDASPTAYTFKKNPDYYVKGIPYADGVVLNIGIEFAAREAQFQAGKLDFDSFPVADVDPMKKAAPKANFVTYSNNLLWFLFFTNVTAADSPFHDVRMRRAASLALDRKGLLDIGFNGQGAWSNIINAGMGKWWLDPQGKEIGDPGKWYKHDPQQAKQLLTAAGHANTEFKFLYPNNAYAEPYNTLADAARGMLADAGFKLTVVTVDYNTAYMNSGQGIFYKGAPPNTIVFALESQFSDPDDYLSGMLTANGNRNHSRVDDPDLAALIKKEQAEVDETKRLELVKQIQRMASDLMYYAPANSSVVNSFYQSWLDNRFVTNDYTTGLERNAYLSLNK